MITTKTTLLHGVLEPSSSSTRRRRGRGKKNQKNASDSKEKINLREIALAVWTENRIFPGIAAFIPVNMHKDGRLRTRTRTHTHKYSTQSSFHIRPKEITTPDIAAVVAAAAACDTKLLFNDI